MKISVVTACFNSEATIAHTIESFLSQTHADKEMLVIDGGSRDDTLGVVARYASPQIIVSSEPDKGVFDAMNKGLARFTGDAVGFLNSDDTFHSPEALAQIAEGLANADIAYGDLHMVTDHETKKLVRVWRAGGYSRYAFQLGWQPPHPSFYMRRAVVDKVGLHDLSYPAAADYDFMLRAMALNTFRIAYVPEVTADFMMGGISTRDWRATVRGTLETLRSRRAHLKAPPVDAAIILRLVRRVFQLRSVGAYLPKGSAPPADR